MKPIGGFFELETVSGRESEYYHSRAIPLSTGRACLRAIIQFTRPKLIYVPFYACDTLLEPIRRSGIALRFYRINRRLEVAERINVKSDEYLLYVNYFGLKKEYVAKLRSLYAPNFILDNTHAFYEKQYSGLYSFNSARKWFGVPDGAFLYCPQPQFINAPRNKKISSRHLISRRNGNYDKAYQEFVRFEKNIGHSINRISLFSEKILKAVNYRSIAARRTRNFRFLHRRLQKVNRLEIDLKQIGVPFCYPFLPSRSVNKEGLFEDFVFVPSLWNDVLERNVKGFAFEKRLSSDLLPLPIDHRYGKTDMKRILSCLDRLF